MSNNSIDNKVKNITEKNTNKVTSKNKKNEKWATVLAAIIALPMLALIIISVVCVLFGNITLAGSFMILALGWISTGIFIVNEVCLIKKTLELLKKKKANGGFENSEEKFKFLQVSITALMAIVFVVGILIKAFTGSIVAHVISYLAIGVIGVIWVVSIVKLCKEDKNKPNFNKE